MAGEKTKLDRRSTRLAIAIPVTISGVDAEGQAYTENVRTVVINKHGGKIATSKKLAMGASIRIENPAMHTMGIATVVWLNDSAPAGETFQVGVQLLEAQNIWGIAFPPDDWVEAEGE